MTLVNQEQADVVFSSVLDALTEKEREVALLIHRYGGIDGAHHKQWVLDQIIRTLVGEEKYADFIEASCFGDDGPGTYEWDQGIAP